MDLRRRNKQHVMETMDGKTPAPRAHEFGLRAWRLSTSTGWITWPKVAMRPPSHLSSVGACCLASGYSDRRLDFDDGGRREGSSARSPASASGTRTRRLEEEGHVDARCWSRSAIEVENRALCARSLPPLSRNRQRVVRLKAVPGVRRMSASPSGPTGPAGSPAAGSSAAGISTRSYRTQFMSGG